MSTTPALLVLENGRTFEGKAYGAVGETLGEIVFNTGMTGYQESLTDRSSHRQIVVMTAPHVGNTGINDEDSESRQIWVAGYVVRDPARRASSWRSKRELADDLVAQGIVGISDVDTRELTRVLRDGVMRAGIFSGDALEPNGARLSTDELLEKVLATENMKGAHLADEVSVSDEYVVEPPAGVETVARIVAVDLGLKAMTPQLLSERGVEVTVVPSSWTAEQILERRPDGVFFSNGPGDPAATTRSVEVLREILNARVPFFGICLGHQLFARALGYDTYKLKYGHRGINQPVKDLTTGRVEITAHNHGFAVDVPLDGPSVSPAGFGHVRVSHVNLNDNVVEGLECLDIPAFSVQYHPEAAAGPHDAAYLFDRFVSVMKGER